jgi:hypothetical protein
MTLGMELKVKLIVMGSFIISCKYVVIVAMIGCRMIYIYLFYLPVATKGMISIHV